MNDLQHGFIHVSPIDMKTKERKQQELKQLRMDCEHLKPGWIACRLTMCGRGRCSLPIAIFLESEASLTSPGP